MKAISIRQPWAWLITNQGKDVENRTWPTNFRGWVLLHAGIGTDTELVRLGIEQQFGIVIPEDLPTGGIVGVARIVDCVQHYASPWFVGPHGFVLADARPLPFHPMKGRLGIFETGLELSDLEESTPQANEKQEPPSTMSSDQKNGNGAIKPPLKIEVKSVKHTFTQDERNNIGGELARTIGGLRGIEAEFDQVKASFKARITEAEARIDKLSTDMVNGFEMRNAKCVVHYRPQDRKKDFIQEEDWNEFGPEAHPALTEDMVPADFQAELIQAESAFDNRKEIELFPRANNDFGVMVLGSLKGRWYSALRIAIGQNVLNQRLDSEQPSDKTRWGAIRRQAVYLEQWLTEKLGKDNAKGFKDPIEKALNAQKELVE
jgi:hypothetical protein